VRFASGVEHVRLFCICTPDAVAQRRRKRSARAAAVAFHDIKLRFW
jgi:hypothetical protein